MQNKDQMFMWFDGKVLDMIDEILTNPRKMVFQHIN